MTEHVSAWLSAYHDGELQGRRLRQVETHLAQCASCRAELERLQALSVLLQMSPAPGVLTSPGRFVAQVGLRLPRRPERSAWQKALLTGWRLIPLVLLGAWVFIQAVSITTDIMSVMLQLGLGGEQGMRLLASSGRGSCVVELLALSTVDIGQIALCAWELVSYVALPGMIGLLYWSWLATWVVRRQSHRPGG